MLDRPLDPFRAGWAEVCIDVLAVWANRLVSTMNGDGGPPWRAGATGI